MKKGEKLDRGNTQKQKKAVIKSKRKVGKKSNQCKNAPQKQKPPRSATKHARESKILSNAPRRLRSVSDNPNSRAPHGQHVMYLRQKRRQVLYNLRRLKGRGVDLTTKEQCSVCANLRS